MVISEESPVSTDASPDSSKDANGPGNSRGAFMPAPTVTSAASPAIEKRRCPPGGIDRLDSLGNVFRVLQRKHVYRRDFRRPLTGA